MGVGGRTLKEGTIIREGDVKGTASVLSRTRGPGAGRPLKGYVYVSEGKVKVRYRSRAPKVHRAVQGACVHTYIRACVCVCVVAGTAGYFSALLISPVISLVHLSQGTPAA